MDYTQIFNLYDTYLGIPFLFLTKRVTFPLDDTLNIYAYIYVEEDTAWTIVSYKLYGSIDYWWVVSALNPTMKFYAERGTLIKVIVPSQLETVLKYI